MVSWNMNRSSCASGSGYVPSCSMGFCVANTKKGSGSACVCPAAGEERSDEIVDDLLLPDDAAGDLRHERRPRLGQFLEQLDIAVLRGDDCHQVKVASRLCD